MEKIFILLFLAFLAGFYTTAVGHECIMINGIQCRTDGEKEKKGTRAHKEGIGKLMKRGIVIYDKRIKCNRYSKFINVSL